MAFIKHPKFGSKHVSDVEANALELEGWIRWPRTKEQKTAKPAPAPAPAREPIRK